MVSPGMVGVANASKWMTVAGRYRLVAVVGSGTRGRVWRAYDELLDREVAVKELAGAAGRRPPPVEEPGLLRVFDVVRTTGRSWIVMEFVRSRSLHDRVTQDGPLNHREATSVGLGLARALAAVHAGGVRHRGVEPRHVLIADDGRVVLTHLGVAPAIDPARSATGGTQQLFGARHYVAPELRAGGPATAAADLWSLGATLYTAVEGFPPLGGSAAELLNPGPLHAVIADLLAVDPAARPTANGAWDALQVLADRAIGVSAVPLSLPPADDGVPASVAAPGRAPVEPRRRRRLRRAVLVAATVTVTAGAVAAAPAVWAAAPALWAQVHAVRPAAALAAPLATGPCAGATPQSLTTAASAPISLPAGWAWHVDPAGFSLAVPANWSRAAIGGTVCFSDPRGAGVFSVNPELLDDDGPLLHWQSAEIAALAGASLPGYQRVSIDALPGGGADWEYTWQPATGPRLHTQRVLPTAAGGSADALTWTTPDAEWAANSDMRSNLIAGFRGPAV